MLTGNIDCGRGLVKGSNAENAWPQVSMGQYESIHYTVKGQ